MMYRWKISGMGVISVVLNNSCSCKIGTRVLAIKDFSSIMYVLGSFVR